MASFTSANASKPVLGLSGFPGLEMVHHWIGIPIFSAYLVATLGNCTILYVIWTEPGLHQPMYYFLAMLATTDLGLCLTTVPTVMGVLWFQLRKVSVYVCISQLFIVHSFSFMESAVLFAMAIDRFLAIRFPLRLSIVHRFGRHASPLLHVIMGNIYILLPPLMNPIIYSIKTNQIYSRILRIVSPKSP
uniref:Uncharacterized protein n=1 Tax=Sphaerodactylus townsendi TaxID=933632 RepID=A0ACB8FFZ3_9SAUR